jgi:eukaryotic-like serine/threonine-protein kinase
MNTDPLHTIDLSSIDCMRSTITQSHHNFSAPIALAETPRLDQSVVIHRTLGSGGMGIVYLAEQQQPRRLVAVKGLREECKHLKPNLIQEAMITGALEHPNIVPVHFLHEANSEPQVVMKYINGKTLSAVCDNQELSGSKLRQIIRQLIQICYALSYAHTKGVYHRDVKPENIMLGDFGEVYLLDWGIAISKDQPMTKPQLVGSPAYMAPEMVGGDPTLIDERTDVFLLGATLHEVLTGKPRHNGDNIHEVLENITTLSPYSYGTEIPEELAVICNDACSKSPLDRIQSIDLFQGRLQDYLKHEQAIILSHSAKEEMDKVEHILTASSKSETNLLAHYNRARFGFNQALQIWPECLQAKNADNRLLTIMLDYYLDKSDLNRSKNIYEQMPHH